MWLGRDTVTASPPLPLSRALPFAEAADEANAYADEPDMLVSSLLCSPPPGAAEVEDSWAFAAKLVPPSMRSKPSAPPVPPK